MTGTRGLFKKLARANSKDICKLSSICTCVAEGSIVAGSKNQAGASRGIVAFSNAGKAMSKVWQDIRYFCG